MNTPLETAAWRLGPDLIQVESGALVVYSPRDMAEWVVREYSRPIIWIRDRRYYLRCREPLAGPFRWRYVLFPWPDEEPCNSASPIFYSDDYVAGRERALGLDRAAWVGHCLLLPFYPLLGFLWSGLKERLATVGFNARSVTSLSLALQLGLVMLLGIFVGYLGFWSVERGLLLALLGLDLVLRYDGVLHGDRRPLGFLEWCWRR